MGGRVTGGIANAKGNKWKLNTNVCLVLKNVMELFHAQFDTIKLGRILQDNNIAWKDLPYLNKFPLNHQGHLDLCYTYLLS